MTVDSLPVTTVARTLVDMAGQLSVWRVEGLALHARQRGMLDAPDLRARLDRRTGLRGLGKARQACDALEEDDSDSILERRARSLLRSADFQPTDGPHPIQCAGATLWADMAFPEAKVAVECDGRAFHSSARAFERDRRRWNLLRDAGWSIVWVTWDRLHAAPQAFIADVRRALSPRVPQGMRPPTKGGWPDRHM